MKQYEAVDFTFQAKEFLPDSLFEEVTEVRVMNPETILQEAKSRKRRSSLTTDGKLLILATDHPGRGVTTIRDEPLIMGNRQEYLARILRVMMDADFDGVMGTTDMIEDLIILDHLIKKRGGKSFLDNRLVLGCMNRGGLLDAVFEMDDTFTSFTPESLFEMRLDGGKMMYRLDHKDHGAGRTITTTAQVINRMNELDIPVFLEPLTVEKTEKGYKVLKDYATLVRALGIGAALGDSTRNMWLKIPYTDNYEQVAKATTVPVLMLGGAAGNTPEGTIQEFTSGMKVGGSIRGAMVGRNITFAKQEDPLAVAAAVSGIIHRGFTKEQALEIMQKVRGKDMDALRPFKPGGSQ